jgi:hypothetical protein
MDEKEANWGLKNEQDEVEQTETLQIFVGTSESSSAPSWDIPDEEDDDPFDDFGFDDNVPTPMILNLGALEIQEDDNSNAASVPVGVQLHSIQEVQEDEDMPSLEPDEWGQINWDDVTLSDILGDETDIDEPPTEIFGAALSMEEESSEEIFPVQVSLEDIPDWSEDWDQDISEEGAELNLGEEWFSSDEITQPIGTPPPIVVDSTHTAPLIPAPVFAARKQDIWSNPLVIIWLLILAVSFLAALTWRLMQ